MSYREVPAWLTDARPTVLLDGEAMTPESVTDSGGTWTTDTDAGPVEVRLEWDGRIFTHASAALPDADNRLALDFSSAEEDRSEGDDADPVFTPESDRREFEIRLVAADSADGDQRDADSGGTDT